MPPVINEATPIPEAAPVEAKTPPSIFGQSSLEFNGVSEAAEAAAKVEVVTPEVVAPAAEKKPEQFIANQDGSFSLQTRVDGKDFAKSFTPEEIAIGLRQSETFNQRMQQVALEKKALENRSQSLNAYDPNTLEIAKSLEALKKSDPSAFNELQYKTNSHLINPKAAPVPAPVPIISKEDMASLDEMAKTAPSVGVLKTIMLKLAESNEAQSKENLELRSKISENQTSFKDMQSQSQAVAKADQNQKVHNFLVSKNVDSATIIAKSDEYDKLLSSGIPAEQAVNYVFSQHFKDPQELTTQASVQAPNAIPEGYQAVVPNASGASAPASVSIFGSSKRVF